MTGPSTASAQNYEDDDWPADMSPDCFSCGGDGWEECDDPIQCCKPSCDGELHRCGNCGGSGLAKDQTSW